MGHLVHYPVFFCLLNLQLERLKQETSKPLIGFHVTGCVKCVKRSCKFSKGGKLKNIKGSFFPIHWCKSWLLQKVFLIETPLLEKMCNWEENQPWWIRLWLGNKVFVPQTINSAEMYLNCKYRKEIISVLWCSSETLRYPKTLSIRSSHRICRKMSSEQTLIRGSYPKGMALFLIEWFFVFFKLTFQKTSHWSFPLVLWGSLNLRHEEEIWYLCEIRKCQASF